MRRKIKLSSPAGYSGRRSKMGHFATEFFGSGRLETSLEHCNVPAPRYTEEAVT